MSARTSSATCARALALLAEGRTVEQVAAQFGVTPATVKRWRTRSGPHHAPAPEDTGESPTHPRERAGCETVLHRGAPARLHTLVVAQRIEPPVVTQVQLLPFESLAWENFERLCLRLAVTRGSVESCADHAADDIEDGRLSVRDARLRDARLYGGRGQRQKGIDLYVRLAEPPGDNACDGRLYLTVQSRRIITLTAKGLRDAVNDFLAGPWARVSRVFAYAVSLPVLRTQLADEIITQTTRLKAAGIDFEVWDGERLSIALKHEPRLVHDFFGRAWTEQFCGPDAARQLRSRLDAERVGALRERLGGFYATFFAATDSGAAALRTSGAPGLGLRDRFVVPDVLVGSPLDPSANLSAPAADPQGTGRSPDTYGSAPMQRFAQTHASRYPRNGVQQSFTRRSAAEAGDGAGRVAATGGGTSRTGVDGWLSSGECLLLVGEPGAGKSTMLRYLLLDLLSDRPSLEHCASRFGDRLPVWLPFHFVTRRKAHFDGADASLAATLKAWLEEQDEGQLWDLVGEALEDERLLLIVDGLDEWVDERSGRLAAKALEVFIAQRGIPALVSSRPFGLTRLQLGAQWRRADLAGLSDAHQRQLARLWFGADQRGDIPASPPGADLAAAQLERTVQDFFAELRHVPELRRLAAVPLFLLALIGLRLSGIRLPTRRFDVYHAVVDQLLHDHPALRATAASVSGSGRPHPGALRSGDVRIALAHVAHAHQIRGEFGPVAGHAVRRDVIAALKDPAHLAMDEQHAASAAGEFLDVAEGELGVLVRHGQHELGFLHRVLLEQLAAEHLVRLEPSQLHEVFAEHAADPRWREVLLAALWQIRRPAEMTALVTVLAGQTQGEHPAALAVRELLAEILFGGYQLPAPVAREHAEAVLAAIETHPHLPHRERLLTAAVPGLGDPTLVTMLRERLARWAIARPLEPGALFALTDVSADAHMDTPVWPRLVAALRGEDLDAAFEAADALAQRYGGTDPAEQVRDALVDTLGRAPTAGHAAAVLLSLVLGWGGDESVLTLTAAARAQQATPLRLIGLAAALGVLNPAGQTHAAHRRPDRSASLSPHETDWLMAQLGFESWSPGQRRLLPEVLVAAGREDPVFATRVRRACLLILAHEDRGGGDRRVAWQVLLSGHAEHPDVVAFVCSRLAADRPQLTFLGLAPLARAYQSHPAVAAAVEEALDQWPHLMDHDLCTLAAIDQGPVMRARLLASLTRDATPHWAPRALAERWPRDEQVTAALRQALAGEPQRASRVANAAVPVLGPRAAVNRLLEILAAVRGRAPHARPDIVAYELVHAFQALDAPDPALAERIAAACLDALDDPDVMFGADAQAAVIEKLSATDAVKARVTALLQRPQAPLRALITGYAHDDAALPALLDAVDRLHPALPTSVRRHLCLELRDAVGDGAAIREITAPWFLEPDELCRSAAAAAFHTHLRRDRDEGGVSQDEWDAALATLREVAVSRGMEPRGADLYHRRSAAWLGALLLDQIAVVGDLSDPYDHRPLRMPLGEPLTGVDMITLGVLAEKWPRLREHFGESLLERFGGREAGRDTTWERLALIADRQPLLAAELEKALAADPRLLQQDAVLAWYASAHRGEPRLLEVLIGQVDADSTNARSLASALLAEPRALGMQPAVVRTRLHEQLAARHARPDAYLSGALEALADGFPEDEIVHACWRAVRDRQRLHGRAWMHPRTYLPLAYAAVPADQLREQIVADIARLRLGEDGYFDNQFTRAVVHRLRRDAAAQARLEEAVCDPDTAHGEAAQLAGFLVAAEPLSQPVVDRLAERLQEHLSHPTNRPALEYTPLDGVNVGVALVAALDASLPG